jgi:hypothetical protein
MRASASVAHAETSSSGQVPARCLTSELFSSHSSNCLFLYVCLFVYVAPTLVRTLDPTLGQTRRMSRGGVILPRGGQAVRPLGRGVGRQRGRRSRIHRLAHHADVVALSAIPTDSETETSAESPRPQPKKRAQSGSTFRCRHGVGSRSTPSTNQLSATTVQKMTAAPQTGTHCQMAVGAVMFGPVNLEISQLGRDGRLSEQCLPTDAVRAAG